MYHIYVFINEDTEYCYNIYPKPKNHVLTAKILVQEKPYRLEPYLKSAYEYGPKLNFATPWSSNVLSLLNKSGITDIQRIERSVRYSKPRDFDHITQMIYPKPLQSFQTTITIPKTLYISDIEQFGIRNSLGFDKSDIQYYNKIFNQKLPTDIELFDLAQSNSEHSRHWFFKGDLYKNNKKINNNLFQIVQSTLPQESNSVIAFSDNSSAIQGAEIHTIINNKLTTKKYHITFTAETHNFPTGIAPFPGAATGVGGRIRDNQSIGRGGLIVAGCAGYSVGDIYSNDYQDFPNSPLDILVQASNGASDYGNKIGEPIIGGFTRSYRNIIDGKRVEYIKPIMFSSGIGLMDDEHKTKSLPNKDMIVVKVGGPAYKIGIGGGSASSRSQNNQNKSVDMTAVQRGDPEMGNRLNHFVRSCVELGKDNPILSIHDQGAGGTGNVTKEIVYPNGATINLDNVILGDESMSPLEIWTAEFQEQNTILINKDDYYKVQQIAERENVPIANIGFIDDSKRIKVNYKNDTIVDLDLDLVLGKIPPKQYHLDEDDTNLYPIEYTFEFYETLCKVLNNVTVGSKRFLTNKVDRSVTGLIAQQQCVGPLHTPISNYSMIAQSHFGLTGAVTSIGEQPIKGLINPEAMGRITVGEMITNMMFAKINNIKDIKCSGNWMWAMKYKGEKDRIYRTCKAACDFAMKLGISFDGGKDSLSMAVEHDDEIIKAPGTFVVSGYAFVPNILNKVTPDFKNNNSNIVYVDLGKYKNRLGGSVFAQVTNQLGDVSPDVNYFDLLRVFHLIQNNLDTIYSGHDRSDGGLITTILEMCFAGNVGCELHIDTDDWLSYFFNEELGLVLETNNQELIKELNIIVPTTIIGKTTNIDCININDSFKHRMTELREEWEKSSHFIELKQADNDCVEMEKENRMKFITFKHDYKLNIQPKSRKIIGVVREEGSNGHKEMMSAFYKAGNDVCDITMTDIFNHKTLNGFDGLAFVGGFSYSDVLGSATGWYESIINNTHIFSEFTNFYRKENTFSLGVCNGCQLLVKLGWISNNVKIVQNKSKRFESRYVNVYVNESNSVMLKPIQKSVCGVWIAHGEGQFVFKNRDFDVALSYVDNNNQITHKYPYNPNGSNMGVAGIVSKDGRHLAMMPHPERCFMNWQCPYSQSNDEFTPWYYMF